ncbi:hypothetical protein HD806DRAFT_205514 [Xylariaceae sp. AK1471]|nr:hypothetical protein HD806DRAFT_205514 [Xylariaceae sp. AK1471]
MAFFIPLCFINLILILILIHPMLLLISIVIVIVNMTMLSSERKRVLPIHHPVTDNPCLRDMQFDRSVDVSAYYIVCRTTPPFTSPRNTPHWQVGSENPWPLAAGMSCVPCVACAWGS